MNLRKFIDELKKRNVVKSTIAYLAVSWILLQVLSLLLPLFDINKVILKTITLGLFIGLPLWILISWEYEISTNGIERHSNLSEKNIPNTKFYKLRLIVGFLIIALLFILFKPKWEVDEDLPLTHEGAINQNNLSSNKEALDFYYKGEIRQKKETLADLDTSIVYFKKAVDLDSNFAVAYSALASSYMRKNLTFEPNNALEDEAYAAAKKALSINPELANPYIIQGQFYWSKNYNFAHEHAISEFKKAISKDNSLSLAYEQLSLVQLHIGAFDKALKNAKESLILDPGNLRARRFMAEALLFKGDYELAIKEFNKIPNSFAPIPTQSLKALNLFYLGQKEEALNIIMAMINKDIKSSLPFSVYAILLASNNKPKEAKIQIEAALQNADNFIHAHHIYYNLAITSAILGEHKSAINWIKKAADTGFPNYPLFNTDPNLEMLKTNKEFISFLTNLKKDWEHYKSF